MEFFLSLFLFLVSPISFAGFFFLSSHSEMTSNDKLDDIQRLQLTTVCSWWQHFLCVWLLIKNNELQVSGQLELVEGKRIISLARLRH